MFRQYNFFQNLFLCFIFFLCLSGFSCNFLNFSFLETLCSVKENELFYSDDEIVVNFSFVMEEKSVEKNTKLSKNGKNLELSFEWEEKSVKIKPKEGWSNGDLYSFEMNGSLRSVNKGTFKENLNRSFYYGFENQFLILENEKDIEEKEISNYENLTFVFSKSVNQYSFAENFSILPSVNFTIVFEGKKVYIIPDEKWENNTTYIWKLGDLRAEDGYCTAKNYSGKIFTEQDKEIPVENSPTIPRYRLGSLCRLIKYSML